MYVRNADGSLAYDKNSGNKIYDYGDGSSTNSTRNFMSMSNPKGDLLYNKEEYLMDILNGKWFIELSPIEGLKLTGSLGAYIDNTRYNVWVTSIMDSLQVTVVLHNKNTYVHPPSTSNTWLLIRKASA